ncbi:cell wall/surface repeat-containing protein [Listeria floridensis FSL S10-1187]|uniref:Cell wall/surface repeat-containing protein n=1 Tax=Listeria floridensis FSL S10-1187 TaxID=1265817 RepID=A0ABN0RG08_9LIST|nr:InlB B-repeat-containing protein [Listeria floridensis]EUJ32448.1 cell wall/surface repeat-containing protein [Listeria floridensis FSL S10-1187]
MNELPLNATVTLQYNQIVDLSVIENFAAHTDLRLQNQEVTLPFRYVRGDEPIYVDNVLIKPDGSSFTDLVYGGYSGNPRPTNFGGYDAEKNQVYFYNLETLEHRFPNREVIYAQVDPNYPKYGVWVRIPFEFAENQTVTYDPAGGELTSDDTQQVFPGEKVTKPNAPTREGYTFEGWAYETEEETVLWDFETQTMPNSPLTLQATWSIQSYALHYNANTMEAVTNVPESQSFTVENYPSVPTETPTREGYTFGGWNTQPDGLGETIQPGESWSELTETTLYAQWKVKDWINPTPDPEPKPDPDPDPIPEPDPTPFDPSPSQPENPGGQLEDNPEGTTGIKDGTFVTVPAKEKETENNSTPVRLPQTGDTPILPYLGLGTLFLLLGLRKWIK